MNTDERIHTYCHNTSYQNNNDGIYLQDTQKLMEEPRLNQLLIHNNHINTQYYIQNQLNDEIKYNSINLLTSYWNGIFESIKLVNSCCRKIFKISNSIF